MRPGRWFIFPAVVFLAGCQKGCVRGWMERHGVGQPDNAPPGGSALDAIDCPDGMARCDDGVVETSVLATIPRSCKGTSCACPWERAGDCARGCVASGATVAVSRETALTQLCRPAGDAGPSAVVVLEPAADCDEDVVYRCTGGAVVSCSQHAIVGRCARGCATEGADLDDEVAVDREGAFAILCSR
jgi:hypothetical protein